MAAGLSPFGFWDLTLWDYDAAMSGAHQKLTRDRQDAAWLAWHIGALARTEKLPNFDDFVRPGQTRGAQSDDALQASFDAVAAMWGASS